MTQRVTLEDLVDLEIQLQKDEQEDPQRLRQRDAAIGQEIGADQIDDLLLPLTWLNELRKSHPPGTLSAGKQVKQFLGLVGWTLALVGFLFGVSTIAGWLRIDPTRPVNVIFFWGVVVGLQILLLFGWILAVLPRDWIARLPGAGALQILLQGIGRLLPVATSFVAERISEDHRQTMVGLRGTFTRFDWLYGRIRFWLLVSLTQSFALSYNVGAVGAFVALTHGNDPAFCWRSTNWEDETIYRLSRAISFPWQSFAEQATLTLSDVKATRYSSSDQEYAASEGDSADKRQSWKRWSLFLLASLITYGLIPRSITWAVAHLQAWRSISRVKLDHAGYHKLRDRLLHHFVETRALQADEDEATSENGEAVLPPPPAPPTIPSGPGPFPAIKCDGVELPDDEIEQLIQSRLGKSVASVHNVLGSDFGADSRVLENLSHGSKPAEVFLLVEAWRPPVGEYLDLIGKLRTELGEGRMIDVLLYDRDTDGNSIQPRPRHSEMWQRKLATIGDPWLRVDPLIEEPVA